jgi:hypothetical protein
MNEFVCEAALQIQQSATSLSGRERKASRSICGQVLSPRRELLQYSELFLLVALASASPRTLSAGVRLAALI